MDRARLASLHPINWNPGRRDLRRFALSMLVGFTVLGLLVALRRRGLVVTTGVLWSVGVALAVVSCVPRLGRLAYLAVNVTSGLLGFAISRVILTVVFLIVFTPLALALRLARRVPLRLRWPGRRSGWVASDPPGEREAYYRQF